jgi:hypothetical protein
MTYPVLALLSPDELRHNLNPLLIENNIIFPVFHNIYGEITDFFLTGIWLRFSRKLRNDIRYIIFLSTLDLRDCTIADVTGPLPPVSDHSWFFHPLLSHC